MKKNVWLYTSIGLALMLILLGGFVFLNQEKAEDLDVYFFLGGEIDSNFAGIVHSGAVAAAEDLNLDINFIESNWNAEISSPHLS